MPLIVRRRAARIIATFQRVSGRRPIFRESVLAIRELTGVGTREAYRAAKISDVVRLADAFDWGALAYRSRPGLLKDLARVKTEGVDQPVEHSDDRTVILAGIHAGSLPIAISWLIQHRFPGWPVLVIKTRHGDTEEVTASTRWPALGIDIRFATLENGRARASALLSARRRTLVVCMADMPRTYGRERRGKLFWRWASLASGAVDLARLCNGRLLLFSSEARLSCDVLRFSGPHDAARTADEALQLNATVEAWVSSEIIARPGQWHLWDRIDEFALAAAA